MGAHPTEPRPVCRNRKAFHDYLIEERWEAGLVLVGSEVKALREGRAQMGDAYATFEGTELFLVNLHIGEWAHARAFSHTPLRKRKLLLHAQELKRLRQKLELRGYTLIPLALYFNERNRLKVELGLARGKRQIDKRQALKEREVQRELERQESHG